MGALIRAKDWSNHSLGPVEDWPQSLHTTLSIIINCRFPMFLWWGTDLICFYNDAYRPSLGQNGKHPAILGMKAEDAWPEIWEIIKPLIDQVLAGGEATWMEDQLIPIYRNNKIEDVFWTFSYSPVQDETGGIAGVLVTCTETTEKVKTLKSLQDSNSQLARDISERKKTEDALIESEHRFRNVANSAPVLIWMSGTDMLCNFCNTAWLKFTGRTMEQEYGNGWTAGIHPEDFKRCLKVHSTSFNERVEFYIEYRLKRHDGEYRWVSDNGVPRFTAEGVFEGYIGACMDVHEMIIHQIKLKEDDERLNIIIDASELGTWEFNLLTKEIKYSDRYLEILGHSKKASPTHANLLAQLHPDDIPKRSAAYKEAYQKGVLFYDSRIIWEDRSVHWIEIRGKVFYDGDRLPSRIVGTVRDITEEKNYSRQLREREEKFRLLADSMPQHIWTADPEGNLNYFNRSVFEYSGVSFEKMYEEGLLQVVHPDDKDANQKAWQYAIETGEDFVCEHRFRRHDGVYHWQLSRAIPQKDAAGKIQMWVGTSTDIQDQKNFTNVLEKQVLERTRELAQKYKELESMNAELQSFAYVSSHDLQEPLRKIQTFAERILEKDQQNLSATGKDYFRRMQNAAERMQTLIEDLLSYSRTNTTDRVFENTDLNIIVEQVKNELKEDIDQKEAVIETGQLCECKIIPFQIRQLVHNLVGNALKFSKPDVPPYIKITANITMGNQLNNELLAPEKSYCHIRISDNGIGFDPQYKERIFEVFQRLHGRNEFKGTGIGLSIVKKIVENHQGLIDATGETDKGATFDIYLPE